ncbi:helix-turn-helix domain-containing protein [Novosphingobium percolationis]|uniref:helix-turn-helix domain-containing protein n=1 Tax=Novosphingobium percolationis TaxID=2871811 RepID=UPI001CD5FBB2|nr:transcriptional regulator [Novosphingobium percolationis]
MDIFPIRSDADHRKAVQEIERLWDAREGTEEFNRLDILATLVDAYEAKRWPVEDLDPVDTIKADMELNGRSLSDLTKVIGKSRASEILKRRRPLTLGMIRKLHHSWHIPADRLVGEYELSH